MERASGSILKQELTLEIEGFVREFDADPGCSTRWGKPLVGFADAFHPSILALKEIISPDHELPTDVLPDASIVIACYVPFTRALAKSNANAGRLASPEWAMAYEETNAMLRQLNQHLIQILGQMGYSAAVSKEASTFDQNKLISNWSHRHLAVAAGLGTFGINNMLITKSGCCGRLTTLVTDLDVEPDTPLSTELCLYKKNGSCGICVKNCPMGALSTEGYDRQNCYSLCRENAAIYTEFGSSYVDASGAMANSEGSEVCGKCVTASPCAFWNLK